MLKLNERQLSWVQMKLRLAEKEHTEDVAKLVIAAEKPGSLSHQLGWYTASLMYHDLLRADLRQIVALTTNEDPENKATLATLVTWYTERILRWSPHHSTNPVSNLEEELKHKVDQEVREILMIIQERENDS